MFVVLSLNNRPSAEKQILRDTWFLFELDQPMSNLETKSECVHGEIPMMLLVLSFKKRSTVGKQIFRDTSLFFSSLYWAR